MPGGRQAAVLTVRNDTAAAPAEQRRIVLADLVPEAHYRVTWDVSDDGRVAPTALARTGADLMAEGIPVALPGQTGTILYLTAID